MQIHIVSCLLGCVGGVVLGPVCFAHLLGLEALEDVVGHAVDERADVVVVKVAMVDVGSGDAPSAVDDDVGVVVDGCPVE